MATDTRRWTSSCEDGSGVVTVPAKGALLVVISHRWRGCLRSETTPPGVVLANDGRQVVSDIAEAG
jgi:hypothetical protein